MGALTRAFRNLSRRKMRVLLVVIALGLSMAIMVSIPSGVVANQESAQRLTDTFNSTIRMMQAQINQSLTLIECSLTSAPSSSSSSGGYGGYPRGLVGGFNEQFMNESEYMANIISIQGVQAVVPILQVSEGAEQTVTRYGRTFPFTRPEYWIEGIPLNSSLTNNYPILPTNITQGTNLAQGDSGDVVLSLNNTKYFGAGVGGTVNILGSIFNVVGVHGETGFQQTTMLYMNISDAQSTTNHTDEVSTLDVYAENTSAVDTIASAIQSTYPELTVSTASSRESQLQTTETDYTNAVNNAEANLANTQATATQEIIIAIVATSLIVLFVMLYTVRERTKEIGTLKAIGFSNWSIMKQFILEGIFMSAIAGVVGIATGSVGASTLTSLLLPQVGRSLFGGSRYGFANAGGVALRAAASSVPSLQTMLIVFGAAALLGALGSLYPAWRAARIRPSEAMRYE